MGHLRCRIWFCMGWEERELLIYVGWFKMNLWQMFLLIRAHTESDALKHHAVWFMSLQDVRFHCYESKIYFSLLNFFLDQRNSEIWSNRSHPQEGFFVVNRRSCTVPLKNITIPIFYVSFFRNCSLTKVWIFANSRIWTADVKVVIFEINMTALSWQRNI